MENIEIQQSQRIQIIGDLQDLRFCIQNFDCPLFYNIRNIWNASTQKRVMAVRSPSKAWKFNHMFNHIHCMMSENDKNVPLTVRDFHTRWGMWEPHNG